MKSKPVDSLWRIKIIMIRETNPPERHFPGLFSSLVHIHPAVGRMMRMGMIVKKDHIQKRII